MNRDIFLGELRAFRKQTTAQLKRMEKDVQTLMVFRWKIVGAATLVSAVVSLVFQIVRH